MASRLSTLKLKELTPEQQVQYERIAKFQSRDPTNNLVVRLIPGFEVLKSRDKRSS